MAPFDLRGQRLVDVRQPPELQAQLASPKALATSTTLPLAHVDRSMAGLAGIHAISSKQSDSAVTAEAYEDCAGFSQARPDPYDAEALDVAIAACDFDMTGKQAQTGDVGIFQVDIGLINIIGIARNDVAQVIDIDCSH